jgi:hypothetical protein
MLGAKYLRDEWNQRLFSCSAQILRWRQSLLERSRRMTGRTTQITKTSRTYGRGRQLRLPARRQRSCGVTADRGIVTQDATFYRGVELWRIRFLPAEFLKETVLATAMAGRDDRGGADRLHPAAWRATSIPTFCAREGL